MKTQILTTCDNNIQAALIKHKLDAADIFYFIQNENFSTLMPHYYNILGSGVQIIVRSEDLDNAILAAEINNGMIVCVHCGSDDFDLQIKNILFGLLMIIFFVLPAGNLLNKYRCNSCSSTFSI